MIKYLRLGVLFFLILGFGVASAQTWPTGPVKVVVPFPPGGSVDMVARLVSKRLTDSLGQPFVVDNRAGASGNIAAEICASLVGHFKSPERSDARSGCKRKVRQMLGSKLSSAW